MGQAYVVDLETSIKNRGEEAIGKFKASPFHPDNRIVVGALKSSLWETPEVMYGTPAPPPDCDLLIGHNIGFDLLYLFHSPSWKEWARTGRIWDTMLAEYILTGQERKFASLDFCSTKYGGTVKDSKIKEYWNNDIDTEDIPDNEIVPYLVADVENTELVFHKQIEAAFELGMLDLMDAQMEARLATIEMEWNGMKFDQDKCRIEAVKIQHAIYQLSLEIEQWLKDRLPADFEDIKVDSNKLISTVMFGGKLKYTVVEEMTDETGNVVRYKSGAKKGEIRYRNVKKEVDMIGDYPAAVLHNTTRAGASGVYSVDDSALTKLNDYFIQRGIVDNICNDILEYRKLNKDYTTYYKGYGELCWPTDGCIHPSFNHTATDTGRLSCSNPNIQNTSHDKG